LTCPGTPSGKFLAENENPAQSAPGGVCVHALLELNCFKIFSLYKKGGKFAAFCFEVYESVNGKGRGGISVQE